MKAKKCKDALITAYRIDNQELLAKNRRLHEAYIRAVHMANELTALGNILLNQDGMIDECVKQVENEWRKLVDEWRQR